MLDLDSPRWGELEHAYGEASDIPDVLRELEAFPHGAADRPDPFVDLWGSLCHQSTVYPASYAAVPHLVRIALMTTGTPGIDYFVLPAMIEAGRLAGYHRGRTMPADVDEAYMATVRKLPAVLGRIAEAELDETALRYVMAGLAGLKGHMKLSAIIEMLDPDEVEAYYAYKDQEGG